MNVVIYDIETMKEMFLIVVYNPQEDKHYEFKLNRWTNELDNFIKFSDDHKQHWWVGYNNLRFDSQVVEFILRNCEY